MRGTFAAPPRPEKQVTVRVRDPAGPAKPNRGQPIEVAGEIRYHGSVVDTDAATATRLIRVGAAVLEGSPVRIVVQDPHGEPKPRTFAVNGPNGPVQAGEKMRVAVGVARDLVALGRAEWIGAPPRYED